LTRKGHCRADPQAAGTINERKSARPIGPLGTRWLAVPTPADLFSPGASFSDDLADELAIGSVAFADELPGARITRRWPGGSAAAAYASRKRPRWLAPSKPLEKAKPQSSM